MAPGELAVSRPDNPRSMTLSLAEAEARAWNERPVGGLVEYTDDIGKKSLERTRSGAWVVGGHAAVVLLEGRVGGVPLRRCRRVSR